MKAAVLHSHDEPPRCGEFRDPVAGDGEVVVDVGAAGVNHVDLMRASGAFYLDAPELPSVVGLDGVGRLADGRRVYFEGTVAPFGGLAERALARTDALFDVADGVDDAVAAALGNSGLAGWLSVAWRSGLVPGETVLVLGSGGAVGSVALQAARLLGAGRVVAAGRAGARELSLARGADEFVELDDREDLVERLRAATGGGADVTIDSLWGPPAEAAFQAAAPSGRHVQVGHLAAPAVSLGASALRSRMLDVRGYRTHGVPTAVRREAYATLTAHAGRGELTIEHEVVALEDVEAAWERQRGGAGVKLVVVP